MDFPQQTWGLRASSNYFSKASLFGDLKWGRAVNFVPPRGQEPSPADQLESILRVTLQPVTQLRVQTDYILSRLTDTTDGERIFDNHIVRLTSNWQFTNELSLRFIAQYDALLAEPERTHLSTTKNINMDVLMTYRVNPWTALFVGVNTNAQNIFLCEFPDPARPGCEGLAPGETAISRTKSGFLNDGRQFFVKLSYLLRF
jgi:outer membrane receptor for ferrienterochelin and colicin